MSDEVFSSSISEAFRALFKKHDETAAKIDTLTDMVKAWPAQCAEHRVKLTERIANGKVALGIPTKPNGNGIGSLKVWVIVIAGAGLFFGALLVGVIYAVTQFGPEIAKLVE